jgi:hypothetical protein
MTLIREVLNSAHLKYEKNIDYPDDTSEDTILRLAYAWDGIKIWSKEGKEGVFWKALKKDASISATGLGEDDLPNDFSIFIKAKECQAVISDGNAKWYEVSMADGNRIKQEGSNPYIFWIENKKIITLPAISGTIEFPYIKKPHQYIDITDTTEIEIDDPEFLVDYIAARLFLDDDNMSQYDNYFNSAQDSLISMKADHIIQPIQESDWGFGM